MPNDMINIQVPDPIGSLRCPDCTSEFEFTQFGAKDYMIHWLMNHNSIVYTGEGEPEITAKVKVTKEDGTEYEVPVDI